MFDVLAASTLAVGASSVIATYSLAFGSSWRDRTGIALILLAWFTLVLALGAAGVLRPAVIFGLPALGWAVAIPLATLTLLLLATEKGRERVLKAPLSALIIVHALRLLGFWFVLLHAAGRLPAPFAPVAGWGDILAGVLALPAAWLAVKMPQRGSKMILTWNIIGAVDLVAAVTLGLTSLPGPTRVFMDAPGSEAMNFLPWFIIPGFLVPSLLTLHLVVFYRLRADASRAAGPPLVRSG